MHIDVFDVEHGQCSLLTADTGARVLIDCGHNTTTGWRPSTYLPLIGVNHLDGLIITNADEDHASDLHNLRKAVSIDVLVRNPTVTGADVFALKGQHCGLGIGAYAEMTDAYVGDVPPCDFGALTFQYYWNSFPHDFTAENNLSVVTVIRHPSVAVMFTGDIERAGWLKLLERPDFRADMHSIDILVAPHHGRHSGCCAELFEQTQLHPTLTIISDAGVEHATQETVAWYRARTLGCRFGDRERRVLTTRSDGSIRIETTDPGQYRVTLAR